MEKGAYVLVIHLDAESTILFGSMGDIRCHDGYYCYVGSAYGPGGFKRVDRHQDRSKKAKSAPHWHIDYLLDHEASTVIDDIRVPGGDECALARQLRPRLDPIPSIGATDCSCDIHLFFTEHKDTVKSALEKIKEKPART